MTSASKLNFRIVEGSSTGEFDDIYEDFKKDYLDPEVQVKDILEKYSLSSSKYSRVKKLVAEETGVNRKVSKMIKGTLWHFCGKFIDCQKSTGKYRVSKVIDGKYHHFGVYEDIETAELVRDKLMAHGWDEDYYHQLRFELFGEENKSQDEIIKEIYDDFKSDFMRGESVKWLMMKYDISSSTYKIISEMIRREEGIRRKPQMHYRVLRKHEKELRKQQ